ncbi:MAG: tRNA (adenosine(37)-N6)-threonylcarbamoyltransferase complex ATPase subunit type 1 TsaE [Pyrinomonadaceae bacterium]
MSSALTSVTLPSATWPSITFQSLSEEETLAIGEQIATRISGGEIILLSGALGAGKTLLVKGIARALGVPAEEVNSPSFTLVNRYEGVNRYNGARQIIYHIDLYRLEAGIKAVFAVDLAGLMSEESVVLLIEWPERLENYPLPTEKVWRIRIDSDVFNHRTIQLTG